MRARERYVAAQRAAYAPDDVVVLEFLEQADLANGSAWDAFVFRFEPYFLECDDLVGGHIPRLVDDAVRSCEREKTSYQ